MNKQMTINTNTPISIGLVLALLGLATASVFNIGNSLSKVEAADKYVTKIEYTQGLTALNLKMDALLVNQQVLIAKSAVLEERTKNQKGGD